MISMGQQRKKGIFTITTFWVVLALTLLSEVDVGHLKAFHFSVLDALIRGGAMLFLFSIVEPSNRSVGSTTLLGVMAWAASFLTLSVFGAKGFGLAIGTASMVTLLMTQFVRFDARHEWTAPRWSPVALLLLCGGLFLSVCDMQDRSDRWNEIRTPRTDAIHGEVTF